MIKENINISSKKLKEIYESCEICKRKDKKRYKTKGFVETYYPGEKVGIDILQIGPKEKIIICIDYFSRYLYAKVLKTKQM